MHFPIKSHLNLKFHLRFWALNQREVIKLNAVKHPGAGKMTIKF